MTKTIRVMLRGAGKAIDISGSSSKKVYAKYHRTNADACNLAEDFYAVGKDARKACNTVVTELQIVKG